MSGARGRTDHLRVPGSANLNAKLDEEKVAEILRILWKQEKTQREVASGFGVSARTVWLIWNARAWMSVPRPWLVR